MDLFSFAWPRWLVAISVLAIGGLALTFTGCDDTSVAPASPGSSSESSDPGAPLPPDVRLRIQYDQTEVTYSNVWPGSIVGNDAKSRREGAQLMTEFEKTHEVRSYDDEGYLTASYEYLDGNRPGMNMPADAYSDLKSEMPYDPNDQNPVVRSVLEGNEMRYIREDGSMARTVSVDPERFRIDPQKIDSLKAADTSDVDSRREMIRESLEQQSSSLQNIDKNRVAFTQSVSDKRGVSQVKKVVDLRVGKPVYLKYERKDGETSMVETRQYKLVSGVPVKVRSVTYDYDDRKGKWEVVARTETVRKKISVQLD
jgi:hypothetical protein